MTIGGILILVYQINKGKKKKANIKSMYHQTNIIPKQNRSITQETSETPKTKPETIIKPELTSPIEEESESNKTLKTRISSCPKCGSVISDDIQATFCGECGYKFN
jgi:ribosomal protein S27AE